jgi:predicted aspartyl protease
MIDIFNPSQIHPQGLNGSINVVFNVKNTILQFGGVKEENKDVLSFDLSRLSSQVGIEVSGLLGVNMLHALEVRIDYRDGLIDLIHK